MSEKDKNLGFKCDSCYENFRSTDYERVDVPDRDSHPYDYLATCPNCGKQEVPLQGWQINLLKAWDNATGPKNTDLTRFNAISHGLTAKVAQYHPARPGQYDICHGCEYLDEICGRGENKYCLKRTEIYMRHRLAAETGEIDSLKEVYADTQAGAQIILDNMIMAIARTGVEVHEVVTTKSKDGKLEIAQIIGKDGQIIPITNLKAHPLIKPLIEMMSKNGITLTDMMLTKKQQGEDANVQGFLHDEQENRQEARDRAVLFDERQNIMLELIEGNGDPLANVKKLGHGS